MELCELMCPLSDEDIAIRDSVPLMMSVGNCTGKLVSCAVFIANQVGMHLCTVEKLVHPSYKSVVIMAQYGIKVYIHTLA